MYTETLTVLLFCGVVSVLVRLNALLSAPNADTPTGRYYWTHTAYFKQEDWASQAQMLSAWGLRVRIGYTEDIRYHGTRIIDPTDGSVIDQTASVMGQACDRDPFEHWSLLVAGRWRFIAEDGTTGYHLHRYPTNLEWVDGDSFTDEGHLRILAVAGSMYLPGKVYSKTGSEIVEWSASRNIVDWQLRHGTKRRNSRFWLP
jgi:hypothetical protein